MEECIAAILDGVEKVPIHGTPGNIVIYGETAYPVLCNNRHESLIAAAEVGKGRVVVFAHTGYMSLGNYTMGDEAVDDNMKLYRNIRKWVTQGRFSADTKVLNLNHTEGHFLEDSLIIWDNGRASDELQEKMLDYLNNGGAIIVGMTPWGFLQCHGDFDLETIPANVFTKKIGICFTPCYYSSHGELLVSENCAADAHLMKALTQVDDVESFNKGSLTIQKNLVWLPKEKFCEMEGALHSTIEKFCPQIHCSPVPGNPVKTPSEKALVTMMSRAFTSFEECCVNKIPSVDVFPGDISQDPPLECAEVQIDLPKHEMRCFHPTGYYVPAGKELIIRLQGELPEGASGWKVAIGTHTDELFETDAPWSRWPSVQVSMPLIADKSSLKTHSGGLVYFISDNSTKIALNAAIENVVQAPYFDISDPKSKEEWLERRNSPGLWADLVGHRFVISLPASSVRDLDEPEVVLNFWDNVAETHFSLAAVDFSTRRREWIVADQQPRAGYMHAGYPIVTGLDVANPAHDGPFDTSLLNVPDLYKKGSWGMFHELGHNLQDPMWTFAGTSEVTCNIFTLHAMDVICGQKPWIHSWLSEQLPAAEKYLKEGDSFGPGWQGNPGVALFIYAQLARDFGWDAYRKVFEEYRNLKGPERPHNFQNQIDQWISRFSKAAGQNLCPLFHLWGFPISAEVRDSLVDLPLYIPADEIANMVPERVEEVVGFYK